MSAAVAGAYGIGLATVVVVAVLLIGLTHRGTSGGPVTDTQRRWRLLAGLGCLVVAAVIGIVGYLKLSLEPQVNRQIPYMASAGMALVLLSTVGGSLLVAEQLRADDKRIEELENAVRDLAAAVAPAIEAPARRRGSRART
jgi:hypothetical protein